MALDSASSHTRSKLRGIKTCIASSPRSCRRPQTYASPRSTLFDPLVIPASHSDATATATECRQNISRSKTNSVGVCSPPRLSIESNASKTCTESTALRTASKPVIVTAPLILVICRARPPFIHRHIFKTFAHKAGSQDMSSIMSLKSESWLDTISSSLIAIELSVGSESNCCKIISTRLD